MWAASGAVRKRNATTTTARHATAGCRRDRHAEEDEPAPSVDAFEVADIRMKRSGMRTMPTRDEEHEERPEHEQRGGEDRPRVTLPLQVAGERHRPDEAR